MARPFSYSALNSFSNCPRQYKFARIDNVKTGLTSAERYLGNAVHRALRVLYEHAADGIVYPLDKLIDLYEGEWEKLGHDSVVISNEQYGVDDYIRMGREMLESYYAKRKPFNEGKLIGAEMRLMFELPGSSFKFAAQIDLALKRDEGHAEIIDFKTGRRLPGISDQSFRQQMGLYQMALQSAYPQFRKITLTQRYLRFDEDVQRSMSAEEIELLADELRSEALQIQRAFHEDDFPTKESPLCRFCDFARLCPAKRHGYLLEQTDEVDATEEEVDLAAKGAELAGVYIALYRKHKQIDSELKALKEDLGALAGKAGLSVFVGEGGKVRISLKPTEKFIGKSKDADKFARFQMAVRDLKLDDYMIVDSTALMKEMFQKQRLDEDAMKRLEEFVVRKMEQSVRVTLDNSDDD